MSHYFNPVEIIKTDDWLSVLQRKKVELNISSPLIVTSQGNRERLNIDSLFVLESIFDDFGTNPKFDDCSKAIKFCRDKIFDGVLAIGGGSTMDMAKVIMAHLCLEITDIYDLISFKENYPKTIPSIFLPTTHGTASEVTMWGTIWDMDEKKKYSISHPDLYPNTAILDGNLTLSLPVDISIITVMDALSHSFESIWNKNSNVTSTKYAIKAISIILQNVENLKENLSNLKIRNNLLEASNTAGLAFSNTKTAAAHSISYPLTIFYGIPHGIASSMSLLPLLEINKKLIHDSLDRICENNELTYEQLIEKIQSIPQGVIPYTLNNWGIKANQLNKLVEASFTKGRMDNNIKDLSKNDVRKILVSIFN